MSEIKKWKEKETELLLTLIEEKKILERIDGRTQRNQQLFLDLQRALEEKGLHFDWIQIRRRWKVLKAKYFKIKEGLKPSGSGTELRNWIHFEQMDRLLGDRPRALSIREPGIDSSMPETLDRPEEEEGSIILTPVTDETTAEQSAPHAFEAITTTDPETTVESNSDLSETPRQSGLRSNHLPGSSRSRKRPRSSDEFESKILQLMKDEGELDRKNIAETMKNVSDVFENCINKLLKND